MKKLFCFYKNSEFLTSEDYTLHECPESSGLDEFLTSLQQQYNSKMKVVQINFEADHKGFGSQKPLYPSAKATVFILNSFSMVKEDEVLEHLSTAPDEEFTFQSLELKSAFIEKVNLIKKEIAAGRLYQANLTAPLQAECEAPAEAVFKKYFLTLNGPYKCFLPLNNDCTVISFSPELFLEKEGSVLKTAPIKGSLKGGNDFKSELIEDAKEEAELSMIVDLLRNDLNRIEPAGAARVSKHRAPMQLGYIQHTYSEVQIETDKNLPQILNCMLPGGSISGCPKLESLTVISELEPYRRQVYTGTIGWWQEDRFTMNLAIRTFIKHKDKLFYHAGCGIVYDSVAEKEWAEFVLKTGKIYAGLQ